MGSLRWALQSYQEDPLCAHTVCECWLCDMMLTWQMTICSKGKASSLKIRLSWAHGQPDYPLTKPSGPLKPGKNQGPFSRDLIYFHGDLVFIQKILGFNEYIVESHLSVVTYKLITEIEDLDVQLAVLSGMIV